MTFRELLHQKVLSLFVIFLILILGISEFVISYSFQKRALLFQEMTTDLFSLFLSLLAMIASATLLVSNGEEVMVLARKIPRYEYFLGKLLGMILMLLSLTVGFGIIFLIVQHAWKMNIQGDLFFVMLLGALIQASLITAMTLLISTISSSSVFTILVAITCYMIGHLKEGFYEAPKGLMQFHAWCYCVMKSILYLIADFSLFNVSDHKLTSVCQLHSYTYSMTQLAFFYFGIYVVIGCLVFEKKEYM
jgi:hypothetical protein